MTDATPWIPAPLPPPKGPTFDLTAHLLGQVTTRALNP